MYLIGLEGLVEGLRDFRSQVKNSTFADSIFRIDPNELALLLVIAEVKDMFLVLFSNIFLEFSSSCE